MGVSGEPFDVASWGRDFVAGKLSVAEVDEFKRHLDEVAWGIWARRRKVRLITSKPTNDVKDVCILLAMILEELQVEK